MYYHHAKKLSINTLRWHSQKEELLIQTGEITRDGRRHPSLVEEPLEVKINDSRKVVKIGTTLYIEQAEVLTELLINFKELFAWSPNDMPGNTTSIIMHELNIDPLGKLIAHRKKSMGDEKKLTNRVDVGKLVDVKYLKKIWFWTCVANPVLVKKSSEKWQVCVDFRDLNKVFPKNCYPLPRIE